MNTKCTFHCIDFDTTDPLPHHHASLVPSPVFVGRGAHFATPVKRRSGIHRPRELCLTLVKDSQAASHQHIGLWYDVLNLSRVRRCLQVNCLHVGALMWLTALLTMPCFGSDLLMMSYRLGGCLFAALQLVLNAATV